MRRRTPASAAAASAPTSLHGRYDYVRDATLPEIRSDDLFDPTGTSTWFRLVFPHGAHFQGWNVLRDFGPAPGCRFDPQPPPPGIYPGNGVIYLADRAETAILEACHVSKTMDLADAPALYECALDLSGLDLLDLRSGWPARLGLDQGASQLHPRISTLLTRRIRTANPTLAGIVYHSMRDGTGLCLVLWEPARALMSATSPVTDADRTLRAPSHRATLARVATSHGLLILGGDRPFAS